MIPIGRVTIACNGERVVRFLVCLQFVLPFPLMRNVIRLTCSEVFGKEKSSHPICHTTPYKLLAP